jgi:hypothetical protein
MLSNILLSRLTPNVEKLLDAVNLDLSIIHQLLSDIPNSSITSEKMGIKCSSTLATNILQEKL